jgi:hypothetical protein
MAWQSRAGQGRAEQSSRVHFKGRGGEGDRQIFSGRLGLLVSSMGDAGIFFLLCGNCKADLVMVVRWWGKTQNRKKKREKE